MPEPPTPTARWLRVWDLPTRGYHWAQAGLVVAALASGYFAPAWWLSYHVWLGYGIAALIAFRLVWGVYGSHYSRFASFNLAVPALSHHLREVLHGRALRTLGHTPLGTVMVLGLIAVIVAQGLCGLLALGGVENQGPLAGFIGFGAGAVGRRLHGLLAYGLMAMIGLHLVGVWVESRLGRESLVAAMVNGRKRLAAGAAAPEPLPARRGAAMATMLAAAAVLTPACWWAGTVPASGLIALPEHAAYQTECGDCHEVYHPSLLPRASWAGLMAGLSDHFGEDASLEAGMARSIETYLARYAAEAWDTEAANRLRLVDASTPGQITATPFWKHVHRRIDPAVFKTKPVRGPGNCKACHRDAASGRFDDQMIALPKPS